MKKYIPKNIFNYVARKKLKDKSNRPVVIIKNSNKSPRFRGRSYGWETKGGQVIHYPSAYLNKGWSNMVYKRSSLHIAVGDIWLINKICNDYPHLIPYLKNMRPNNEMQL
jgi:hypothetical protein